MRFIYLQDSIVGELEDRDLIIDFRPKKVGQLGLKRHHSKITIQDSIVSFRVSLVSILLYNLC